MILALVIMAIAICDISYDIYAPSLPQIGEFFQVSQVLAQLTVSLNLVGGAVSGLFYGPLSDRFGRRPIILLGIGIFTLASVACCFVNSITALIILRSIQGFGAGVSAVVGYAMVNDMFSGAQCARSLSLVNLAVSFSPVAGPIMGSYILSLGYGWKLLFVIVSCLAVTLIVTLSLFLKETIKSKNTECTFASVASAYLKLVRNIRFLGFALVQSLTISWLWSSLTNLPFVFMEGMHLPIKHYGYVVAIGVLSYTAGTFANRRLVFKIGMYRMIAMGLTLTVVSDAIVVIAHHFITLTPLFIELIWLPSSFGIAFITSNSMAAAFGEVDDKGVASAFIVFWQTALGAGAVYLVCKLYDGTIVPVSVLPIICCSVSLFVIYLLSRGRSKVAGVPTQ